MTEDRVPRVMYGAAEVEELLRRATNVWVRRGELSHLADEDWRLLNAAIVHTRQSIRAGQPARRLARDD